MTGTTSDLKFLPCDINGKTVGIPVYSFSTSTPETDLIVPYTDLVLDDANLLDSGTLHSAGVAIGFYETATTTTSADYNWALPLYKVTLTNDKLPSIQFKDTTLVSSLTSTGNYLLVKINNVPYGIPLNDYSTLYTSGSSVTRAEVDPTTVLEINPTQWNGPRETGSTNLNNKIQTYSDVISRVKRQLGYPIIEIELCDEQIIEYIDMAVEWYTKYAGYTEEFMVFDSKKYPVGKGFDLEQLLRTVYQSYSSKDTALSGRFIDYDLDSFRKVVNVFSFDQAEFSGVDALFSLEYIYAQQVYYSYMLGSYGFDLVTWETLKQFLDTRKRMFGSTPRYMFDSRTQRLRIVPEPDPVNPYIGILGAYVERPIKDIIKERWVQQYTLALSKIALGHIRGKYGNVSLFGGGSIQGGDLASQGLEERNRLEEELLTKYGEMSPPLMFIG